MKSLYEVAVPQERPWYASGFVCGAVVGMIAILLASIDLAHMDPAQMKWLALVLLEAPVIWGCFCAAHWVSEEERRAAIYTEYLADVDVGTLKLATSSPELDQRTRDCIIQFLNRNHQGWSLGHA